MISILEGIKLKIRYYHTTGNYSSIYYLIIKTGLVFPFVYIHTKQAKPVYIDSKIGDGYKNVFLLSRFLKLQ